MFVTTVSDLLKGGVNMCFRVKIEYRCISKDSLDFLLDVYLYLQFERSNGRSLHVIVVKQVNT